jgi:fructokinase
VSEALIIGESLVDVVATASGAPHEYAGGSAANVAVALARLGRPVRLATSYADDRHGRLVADHLAGAGVDLAADPHVIPRTSTAKATLDTTGAARYEFDIDWRLGVLAADLVPLVVHTCSLAAVLAPGADDVLAALARLRGHATVTYDINARPAVTGTTAGVVARVEAVAAMADLVRASDEDLAAFYPEWTLVEAATHLLGLGPAAVVVTRGGEGAFWLDGLGLVEIASRPVTVVDTIGAGDTFGAALIDALWDRDLLGSGQRSSLRSLNRGQVAEILTHAARAAAVTVSRPGADPPWRHELD